MKKLIMPLWLLLRRINRLHRITSLGGAVRLATALGKDREVQIRLLPSNREVVLRCNTSDTDCMEKVLVDEEYETPYPVDARLIVDAGANVGMATLYFAQKYPKAKIIAIEPESSNFKMLERNCAGLPNVVLVNAALWRDDSRLVIKNDQAEKWAFSVTESPGASSTNGREIKVVTIQAILRDMGIGHIDILKLDIEGAECELFKSGTELWLGSVGQIVIELHDRFQPGCAQSLYAAVGRKTFLQQIRGENIFIKLADQRG